MIIRLIEKKDLQSVANLESRVYPQELCLGYYDYLHDYEESESWHSMGAFKGDDLLAYIIAYDYGKNGIYVSDLVCADSSCFLKLLREFIAQPQLAGKLISAELRQKSYQILSLFNKRKKIRITKDQFLKNYHGNGEDIHYCEMRLV